MVFLAMAIEVLAVLAFTAWLFQYTDNPWSLLCLILLFCIGFENKYLKDN